MSVLLTYIFCIYIFIRSGKGSIARVLSLFFVVSLTGFILLFKWGDFEMIDILHAFWIIIVIGSVVYPWKDFKNINEISVRDKKKTETLANILIVLCLFLGFSCAVLAFFVLMYVPDINQFKYVDRPTEFYYSLGIDLKGFILTTLLYPIGYLLIPFFYYYISQKRTKKALLCFLGSMLPVFFGLTYFSRAHMTHFVMMYFVSYFLLGGVFSKKFNKTFKKWALLIGIGVILGFSAISTSRFEEHDYDTENREVSYDIGSTTAVSMIDYFSQWWPTSQEVFRRFDGETMNNAIILQAVNNFFTTITFNLIPNDGDGRIKKRERLLKEFSDNFIGLGAYILYDQGPILGLFILLVYAITVRKFKPRRGKIPIESLLWIFTLIQIPVFAIFYSIFDGVLLTIVFLIPIELYLKSKVV